jgi:diguanylate cyclase (GGDEF)-like protein
MTCWCALGGEEFVALVSVHDASELQQIAERVRMAIAATPMNIGKLSCSVTSSIGTAIAAPGENQASVLERADSALYLAKHQGRDRTVHAA